MKRFFISLTSLGLLLFCGVPLQASPLTDRMDQEDALQGEQYDKAEARFTDLLNVQKTPLPRGEVKLLDATDAVEKDEQALVHGHTFRGISRYYLKKNKEGLVSPISMRR